MPDDLGAWVPVAVVVVLLALMLWGVVIIVATLLGKDIWPYTVKGPMRSIEEEVWVQEAIIEYAKKVPYPGTSRSDGGPQEEPCGANARSG